MVDRLLDRLELPRPAAVPATGPVADRVGRLVELLYRFYERSGDLYPFFLQNRRHPAVQAGLAEFEGTQRGLLERALQGWAGPASAAVVVAALADPSFHANLLRGGLSTDQAVGHAATLAGQLLDGAGGAEAGERVGG